MQRNANALTLSLGFEPPLTISGRATEIPSARRVNGRWLGGIVLTGLMGMVLLFAAATSTIEQRTSAVEAPELIKPRENASQLSGELVVAARKGDRLVRRADIIAARQTYKIPVTRKGPSGEVIRVASFTRVASPLALETLGYADRVPTFNVARLIADASEDRALDDALPSTVDADVALQSRNIEEMADIPRAPNALGEEEVRTQVQEALSAARRTVPGLPAQMLLAKAMRNPTESSIAGGAFGALGGPEPFSRLVVRMVPENVSVLSRLEAALARNTVEQRAITVRSEENVEQIFRGLGVTPSQARDIVRNLVRGGQPIEAGRRLKLTFQSLEAGQARSLTRVDLYNEEVQIGAVGRKDDGVFVPIEAPRQAAPRKASEDEGEEGGFTLFQSLHETAIKHALPKPMIDELIKVLFFDVDLQRPVNGGDSFEVLIGNDDSDNPADLMMLALTHGGETRRFYRFALPGDDVVDYFDDQGRSAKKFLIRKPIVDGELRSTFGNRRHPILGYWRMHNGVDWAAKIGTPILSAGNGVVRFADWDSGYGRRVEVQHTNGYVTTYNHMSAFGRGIIPGARIRQGQIVGYLGSSGLSTGPHLHYEVMINDRHVDPLAIKLPRGRELEGGVLAEFRKMREQTDSILKRAPGSAANLASPVQTARP